MKAYILKYNYTGYYSDSGEGVVAISIGKLPSIEDVKKTLSGQFDDVFVKTSIQVAQDGTRSLLKTNLLTDGLALDILTCGFMSDYQSIVAPWSFWFEEIEIADDGTLVAI